MGQKSDRQKVAMRPNHGPNVWLYTIIIPAISLILGSSFYQGPVLIQFHPPANVTPDFQKTGKKKFIFKTRDF
jgi:hypothetical protein